MELYDEKSKIFKNNKQKNKIMIKKNTLFLMALCIGWVCHSIGQNNDTTVLYKEVENYIYSPKQERKKSKDYYQKIKVLTETGDNVALYHLGMLQKEGLGTKQSFKKSGKSFKKAFELGNSKAAYCLGYYYLKGFGDIQQDYKKAYRWFKKSNEPMAIHWMAKMEFLGLGRESNKKKAIAILNSNDLYNSKVLKEQYAKNEPPTENNSELFNELIDNLSITDLYELKSFQKFPSSNSLNGDWEGEYFELDWAKSKILRVIPLELCFREEKNGINEQVKTELKIADSVATDIGSYSAGALRFGEFKMPIQKQYTDYPNFTHLVTDIQDFELREIQIANETLLIGKVNATYPVWQESANPSIIILRKKNNLLAEAEAAFNEQADDFLRIYPNPYAEYFLLNFDLQQEANVTVEITNHYNTPVYQKTIFDGYKAKGEHTLEIYAPPTKSGSYVVSIAYNGKVDRKIIVKN